MESSVTREDSTISEGSGTETETEMPLSSQEDYTYMKIIQPNLSDEISDVLKQEQTDDDVTYGKYSFNSLGSSSSVEGNTYWKTGARIYQNMKNFNPNGKTRPPSDEESLAPPPKAASPHINIKPHVNNKESNVPNRGRCPVAACTQVISVVTRPGGTYTSPSSVLVRRTCSPPPLPPPTQSLHQRQEPPQQPPSDNKGYASREPVITCAPASPQPSVEPPTKRMREIAWAVQYLERDSNNQHYRNQPGYAPSYPLGESPQANVCQEGQVSSTSVPVLQDVNTIPATQLCVKGKYVFSMEYEAENTKPAKSCNYTFSQLLSKVFAQIDKGVPVKFATELPVPAQNVEIRAYLVFKDIHSREVVVNRCPHHLSRQDQISFNPHHVMDTVGDKNMHVEHTQCPSTHRYVTILKPAVTNSNHMINSFCANLRFRCASSCRGGIDRRPIMALFEFYINDQFQGRASIEVSICSSPGRDRTNQEEKLMRILHPELYLNRPDEENEEKVALEMKDTCFSAKGILKEGRSFEDDTFLIRVKGAQNAELVGRLAKQLNELTEIKNKNKRAMSVLSSNSPSPPAPPSHG